MIRTFEVKKSLVGVVDVEIPDDVMNENDIEELVKSEMLKGSTVWLNQEVTDIKAEDDEVRYKDYITYNLLTSGDYRLDKDKIPMGANLLLGSLQDKGYEAYLVGGCVRDLIVGVEPHNWDIVTNATPDVTIGILDENGYNYNTESVKFGTVSVILRDGCYEITTYRRESKYSDGRHPSKVDFVNNLLIDLNRRDFTINAIAFDPIGDIFIDPSNGLEDIQNKIIRAVGNPYERFEQDSLRMLRAIRFVIKYKFQIDTWTAEALKEPGDMLNNISTERITKEISRMLTCGGKINAVFTRFHKLIFAAIPELKPCYKFNQNNKYHKHDVYKHTLHVVDGCETNKLEIKLAALFHDIGKPRTYTVDENGHGHFYGHPDVSYEITKEVLENRLALTQEQNEMVLELVKNHDITITETPKSIKKILNKHGEEFFRNLLILKQSDINDHIYDESSSSRFITDLSGITKMLDDIITDGSYMKLSDLDISGTDIMYILKIEPCKEIGFILNKLLSEVINGETQNCRSELIVRVLTLHKELVG